VGENCADDRAEVAAPMWAVHAVLGGISSVTVCLLCRCMSVCVCVARCTRSSVRRCWMRRSWDTTSVCSPTDRPDQARRTR